MGGKLTERERELLIFYRLHSVNEAALPSLIDKNDTNRLIDLTLSGYIFRFSSEFSYNFPLGFLYKLNKMSSLRVKPQS